MQIEDTIINLITSFLGNYGKHSGEWYAFDCPVCAEEKGVTEDYKYNLEVKVDLNVRGCGGYHCWRCGDANGTKGTLIQLFRKYSSQSVYNEFKSIVKDYREARKFELIDNAEDLAKDFYEDIVLTLPEGFKSFKYDGNQMEERAISYLYKRGLNDRIIKYFNIGYTIADILTPYSLQNRIIIPSYDAFDNLNYWTGRDYIGNSKMRYKNPKAEKSQFIFNEGKVNWYEPITLVEGPFDHIVVPNSIPLLGKTLKKECRLYERLIKSSHSLIYVFLDDDAVYNAKKIYKLLEMSPLKGKIRMVDCPNGYDASSLYQSYGKRGIISVLSKAHEINEYDLEMIK